MVKYIFDGATAYALFPARRFRLKVKGPSAFRDCIRYTGKTGNALCVPNAVGAAAGQHPEQDGRDRKRSDFMADAVNRCRPSLINR